MNSRCTFVLPCIPVSHVRKFRNCFCRVQSTAAFPLRIPVFISPRTSLPRWMPIDLRTDSAFAGAEHHVKVAHPATREQGFAFQEQAAESGRHMGAGISEHVWT